MSTFDITVDLAKFDAAMRRVTEQSSAAARPAAQAGAQVFYEQVKLNVPVSKNGHWFHGTSFKINGTKYWYEPGSLKAAIYQVYSKDSSAPGNARYHIAWNHKKVPYGFMVEFGTGKAPAHSFLRKARSVAPAVRKAINDRFIAELRANGVVK